VLVATVGRCQPLVVARRGTFDARILWLLVATAACYGVGYPVALLGHSNVGWVLVFLGGPLLLALGVLTVRWLHRSTQTTSPSRGPREAPPG
jgi:hypothetical protein